MHVYMYFCITTMQAITIISPTRDIMHGNVHMHVNMYCMYVRNTITTIIIFLLFVFFF